MNSDQVNPFRKLTYIKATFIVTNIESFYCLSLNIKKIDVRVFEFHWNFQDNKSFGRIWKQLKF